MLLLLARPRAPILFGDFPGEAPADLPPGDLPRGDLRIALATSAFAHRSLEAGDLRELENSPGLPAVTLRREQPVRRSITASVRGVAAVEQVVVENAAQLSARLSARAARGVGTASAAAASSARARFHPSI